MPKAMRDMFWDRIHEEMKNDPQIFVLTADFGAPALDRIAADFPDRFVSVGISEQNLINIAAGLALEGRRVIAYAIAPFFLRCAEQIRINLAMTNQFRPMNVTLVGVGVGFSYVVSGPSHHALEDLSVLHNFPGLRIVTPSDSISAGAAAELTRQPGLRYLRLDSQLQTDIYEAAFRFPECGYTVLRNGGKNPVVLIGSGAMTGVTLQVAERLPDCRVIDLFDPDADIRPELAGCSRIYTLEEGVVRRGGVDSSIRMLCPEKMITGFGFSGPYEFTARSREALRRSFGLTEEQIADRIREDMNS